MRRKFDNIFFITELDKLEEYKNKLADLFKEHEDFYENITSYNLPIKYKEDERIYFINIKLRTDNIDEIIFYNISKKNIK